MIYLSDYEIDFTGGVFEFHTQHQEKEKKIAKIYPKKGMFVTFSSGYENPHRVNKVETGTRFAFSTAENKSGASIIRNCSLNCGL